MLPTGQCQRSRAPAQSTPLRLSKETYAFSVEKQQYNSTFFHLTEKNSVGSQSHFRRQSEKMFQTSGGTTRAIDFDKKIVNNSASEASSMPAFNSEAVENKYLQAGQASEFQMSPDLNQKLSWQAQSQKPLTSPVTFEAGAPHQMPLRGHLGGQGKKKRGRPPGSKNKIKVKITSGQAGAMSTKGPEGLETTLGCSILPQGSNPIPHHNPYNHGGQTNYGLHAGFQYQASMAAGLYNNAHAGGVPTGWPPQPPAAPIHLNYIVNSSVIHNYRQPAHYSTQYVSFHPLHNHF